MTQTFRTLALSAGIAVLALGQVNVQIGGAGSTGCQNPGAPTLSNGDVATATLTYDYDGGTGILLLTVANTTPVVPGANTAVLTGVYFNLPAGTTGVALLGQVQGMGPTAPAFALSAGPDGVGCFGTFSRSLTIGGVMGGIANPLATNLVGPPNSMVIGPATFTLQVQAPDLGAFSSADFAGALGGASVVAAAKFQGSGPGAGEGSGFVGAAPVCLGVQATVTDLGFGCSNVPPEPILSANPPVIGGPFTIMVNSEFAGALIWVFYSFGAVTPTPLAGTPCTVWVDIVNLSNLFAFPVALTDANGDYSITLPLPNAPGLIGLEVTLQSRLCAENGPIGPFVPDWFTNGIRVRIGCG